MKNYNWDKNSVEYKAATKLQRGWGWLSDYQNDYNTMSILSDSELQGVLEVLITERNKLFKFIEKLLKGFVKEEFFGIDSIITALTYMNTLSLNISIIQEQILFRITKQLKNDTNSPDNSTNSSTNL